MIYPRFAALWRLIEATSPVANGRLSPGAFVNLLKLRASDEDAVSKVIKRQGREDDAFKMITDRATEGQQPDFAIDAVTAYAKAMFLVCQKSGVLVSRSQEGSFSCGQCLPFA
jgi:hypothetical protein